MLYFHCFQFSLLKCYIHRKRENAEYNSIFTTDTKYTGKINRVHHNILYAVISRVYFVGVS